MTVAEAEDEYLKAVRLGQKECAVLQGKGQNPFPVVLDQILGDGVSEGAQNVGTLEIPIERIVGVKSAGRISAFSAGFFPLLDCESEFAMKWMTLCRAHQGDEGIRDPIICYEYLGNFYVQEGNKRLSVLKYYGAIRIPSVVYRIVPPMSDNPEIRAYYEFLDFFQIYAALRRPLHPSGVLHPAAGAYQSAEGPGVDGGRTPPFPGVFSVFPGGVRCAGRPEPAYPGGGSAAFVAAGASLYRFGNAFRRTAEKNPRRIVGKRGGNGSAGSGGADGSGGDCRKAVAVRQTVAAGTCQCCLRSSAYRGDQPMDVRP